MESDIRPMCREGGVKKHHPQDCPTTRACPLCDEKAARIMRKHDRHDCQVYIKTITPCPMCLSARGEDVDPEPEDPYVRQVVEILRKEPEKDDAGRITSPVKFGGGDAMSRVMEAARRELERRRADVPHVDMGDLQFLGVMMEELGGIAELMNRRDSADYPDRMREKLVRLAATAMMMLEAYERRGRE